MDFLYTDKAPEPGGHYSQAVIHNGFVYISGQLPIKPGTGEKITGPIEKQTEQVLNNIEAILVKAGCTRNSVIKTTVYISDISLWDKVNKVYSGFFGEHKPARAVVPTMQLHHGFMVEIEAVAVI